MAWNKPETSEEVYDVMVKYCHTKQYTFPDKFLRYIAEECFLTGESTGWKGCRYWPALAMKWVLRNSSRQITIKKNQPSPTKETIRDKWLREHSHDNIQP